MKLFIPELGTELKLEKNHSFNLQFERRNEDIIVKNFLSNSQEWNYLENENKRIDKKLEAAPIPRWCVNGIWYTKWDGKFDKLPKPEDKILTDEEHNFNKSYYKNKYSLIEKLGPFNLKVNKGDVLIVDRIYIRKGAKDFSSVTFRIKGKTHSRFWIPLNEVNLINCSIEK